VTLNRGHLDVAGAALPIDATDLEKAASLLLKMPSQQL